MQNQLCFGSLIADYSVTRDYINVATWQSRNFVVQCSLLDVGNTGVSFKSCATFLATRFSIPLISCIKLLYKYLVWSTHEGVECDDEQ